MAVSSAAGFVVDKHFDGVVFCAVVSFFVDMVIGEVIASSVSTRFVNAAVSESRVFVCVVGVASSISAFFSFAFPSTS